MDNNQCNIPILPPYALPAGGEKKNHMEAILPFFDGGEKFSSLEGLLRASTKTLLNTDYGMETQVLEILKKQYPNKILLPSSYMIGFHKNKIVVLDVKNYGFLAFPGGKGDGGVLSEIIDARRTELSDILAGETQLQEIVKIFRKLRVGSSREGWVNFVHRLQKIDLTGKGLRFDDKVKQLLGFETQEIQDLLQKKLGDIPEEKWLDVILTHAPETFQEILHREYQEETGRKILSSKLFTVLLEEKGPNLLKVRMCYAGEVGDEDEDLHAHTKIEKAAGISTEEIPYKKLMESMRELLVKKMGIEAGYTGNNELQTKKTSTGLGHYLALLIYDILKNKKEL